MLLNIGLIISESQLKITTISAGVVETKIMDLVGLKEENIHMLLIDETLNLESFQNSLNDENKFYPIVNLDAVNLNKDTFELLQAKELTSLYNKVSTRWILSNNIKTIEQIYPTVSYLKNLWIQDRNSFFDELWFLLKTNLATNELNIIFHDLKEPTQKQQEKGDKPTLCYSYVQGTKIPNLFQGKEKEVMLMKEYEKEFSDIFNVTEYNADKGQLVICSKIELSPILLMAKLNNFNQLQRSILIALFTGINS
jgi:hypothetical protein